MLKYYIYVSETKVKMLYPQIPPVFLKGAEAELKVNLGFVSTGIKARGPEEAKELTAQLAAVDAYLRSEKLVGTPDDPRAWISGTGTMRWGIVGEYASDIAYFGGNCGEHNVALIGSNDSVVGMPKRAESNHAPFYYTMKFLNSVLESRKFKASEFGSPVEVNDDQALGDSPYYSYEKANDIAFDALQGSEANLEFLALVLTKKTNLFKKDLIVATPLYVALVS